MSDTCVEIYDDFQNVDDTNPDLLESSDQPNLIVPRKRRTMITKEKIMEYKRLIRENACTEEMIRVLNLSKVTLCRLNQKYIKGELNDLDNYKTAGEKRGEKKQDYLQEKTIIARCLDSNNSLTLKELKMELERNNIIRSVSTIHAIIHKMNYTRKKLICIPTERNSARVMETRKLYCRFIQNISNSSLVFLDEFGINGHTSRSYGYSPVNSKAYVSRNANRGMNVSVLVAIGYETILCHQISCRPFNSTSFKDFLITKLFPLINSTNPIVVMDNCRIHKTLDVANAFNENRIGFKYLPPYSPQLNPIEEVFSSIKARYKSLNPFPYGQENIVQSINNILTTYDITLRPFYEHMRVSVEKGLAGEQFI